MHCGVMVTGYNQGDWERLLAEDYGRPPAVSDAANMDDTLELGELVEPLGFDSIWATEHYGSAYSMQPNPLPLQRRLLLTPCLSPGISFSILITIPGGRGCYRRVGRQGSRLLFPSLHLHGAILRRSWMNSVGSIRPFGPVLPGKSRGTSFSTT